jgi:hypothetical protein
MPLPPASELQWWYQYYFATERGRLGYDKYRHDFAKLIWQLASPKCELRAMLHLNRTAASFDNPDHVAIVIHNLPVAAWPGKRVSQNMTIWKSGLLGFRLLRYRQSQLEGDAKWCTASGKQFPMLINFPQIFTTKPSQEVSGIIYHRKRQRPL